MKKNLFQLDGKVALVTGATQGIGFSIAKTLGEQGAILAIGARNAEKLRKALELLAKEGIEAHGFQFDVTSSDEIKGAVTDILKKLGKIDILVNNAGVTHRHPMEDFPEDEWDEIIDVNLNSIYKVSKYVVKGMIEQKSGKIINICSLMSEVARNSISAYTASKGGVKMLTKAMAVEWAKYNIQVNGIGPGYFETELTSALSADEKFNSWLINRTPAARWGRTEDLAGTAVFLASEASAFVNGQIIYVDGGILATI